MFLAGIFGTINDPLPQYKSTEGSGLFTFISQMLQLAGVVAGLFFAFNIISAGYMYLSANGDAKKTEQAWAKIWQSILGMVIVASAMVLTSVIGNLIGIDPLNPIIKGP
jgi:hypothetical protein